MFYGRKNTLVFLLSVLYFFGGTIFGNSSVIQASFYDFIKAFVTINPLDIEVSIPTEVEIGKTFKVEVTIINKGDVKIEDTEGEIFLPVELSLLGKSTVKNVGVVPGGRAKRITWQIKGNTVGQYIISVFVVGEVNGDPVNAEESKVLSVNEQASLPGQSSNIFIRFFNRLQNLFQK